MDDQASAVADQPVAAPAGNAGGNASPSVAPPPDTSNLPVSTQTAPQVPAQVQPPAKKPSFLADVLHAVGDVLGGPKTQAKVDPNTGKISQQPLDRQQRIANTAGIYLRGAG